MKPKNNENVIHDLFVAAGDFEICADGTIWKIQRRHWDRWSGHMQRIACHRHRAEHYSGQYLQIQVTINMVKVVVAAHRLVWVHFFGPIPDGLTVNHKNGDKRFNNPENLELLTHRDNILHAIRVLGYRPGLKGESNPWSLLTGDNVLEIRRRRLSGEQLASIAEDFSISTTTVSDIALGKSWRHLTAEPASIAATSLVDAIAEMILKGE